MEKEILPNYFQDIKITGFRIANPNATVIVHEVIIRIPFSNGAVTDQYAKIYKEVETKLKETEKCIDGHFTPFCVDGKAVITTLNPPPTEKELCVRNINVLFVNYFEPVVETEGLSCVSECDFSSPKYVDCNTGTCQIKQDGAQCFCPNTHKYLYTYSRCRGAVLIAGMYGGAGAAIAVLVIVAVILGVFFYRKKKY
ncbi:mucin-3A-like [Pyxicephalus adspersus]|uniref:mucin-3A-like n=1 Tax=Pyxicephalus adspersus TaxID=30357 RepID=UPI003B5B7344